MIDPAELALLAAFALAGALVFGLTGFGSALIAMPLALHVVPLPFAIALYALSDLACAFSVGTEKPKNAAHAEWVRLIPAIVAGTVLGVTVLVNLPREASMVALGVFVLAFALYRLFYRERTEPVSIHWAWLAGFGGGLTSALFGAGGPPYVIYLSQRGLSKEAFRATLGLTTLTSISLRVLAFLLTGLLLDAKVWLYALAVVPAALVGIHFGRRMFLRISREALLKAVAVVLLCSGASLVLRAAL